MANRMKSTLPSSSCDAKVAARASTAACDEERIATFLQRARPASSERRIRRHSRQILSDRAMSEIGRQTRVRHRNSPGRTYGRGTRGLDDTSTAVAVTFVPAAFVLGSASREQRCRFPAIAVVSISRQGGYKWMQRWPPALYRPECYAGDRLGARQTG